MPVSPVQLPVSPVASASAPPQFAGARSWWREKQADKKQARELREAAQRARAEKLQNIRGTLGTLGRITDEQKQQGYLGFGPTLLGIKPENLAAFLVDLDRLKQNEALLKEEGLDSRASHLQSMTGQLIDDYLFFMPGLYVMDEVLAGRMSLDKMRRSADFERLFLLVNNNYNFLKYVKDDPAVRDNVARLGLKIMEECDITGHSVTTTEELTGRVRRDRHSFREILENSDILARDHANEPAYRDYRPLQGLVVGLLVALQRAK